jgi:hypothetical protein
MKKQSILRSQLLALSFALSMGASIAAEPPVVFGGDSDFPTPGQTCPAGDEDHDGVCNLADNCGRAFNPNQFDRDADGRGDVCDNCPAVANGTQTDRDSDLVGDACDASQPRTLPSGADQGSSGPVVFGQN